MVHNTMLLCNHDASHSPVSTAILLLLYHFHNGYSITTTPKILAQYYYYYYEPQSRFAQLWLDSQHDNLPKGIRTIKMCKLYSNDARW